MHIYLFLLMMSSVDGQELLREIVVIVVIVQLEGQIEVNIIHIIEV